MTLVAPAASASRSPYLHVADAVPTLHRLAVVVYGLGLAAALIAGAWLVALVLVAGVVLVAQARGARRSYTDATSTTL